MTSDRPDRASPHRLDGLRRLLNRPLFGTTVIPADARADPAKLPEEEFPVHCPKCEYLLRGLTGSVCPECGTPFDRGRLLVKQYVGGGFSRAERRLGMLLAIFGWCLALAPPALIGLYFGGGFRWLDPAPSTRPGPIVPAIQTAETWTAILKWSQLTGLALILMWQGWFFWKVSRQRKNRRRVIDAIPPRNAQ